MGKARTDNLPGIYRRDGRAFMGQVPVRWDINSKRTAIIVVDMQGVFCDPAGAVYIPDAVKVVEPIQRIIAAGRKAAIPIIYLRHVVRGDDSETMVITGTVTNVCCESTVRDAVHREYKVIVVSDACAAQPYPDMGWGSLTAEDVQRVTLTVMAHEFGEVTTTVDLIERLAAAA